MAFLTCPDATPFYIQPEREFVGCLTCPGFLGQPELEFSGLLRCPTFSGQWKLEFPGLLSEEVFDALDEARRKFDLWRHDYKPVHSQSSLRGLTPAAHRKRFNFDASRPARSPNRKHQAIGKQNSHKDRWSKGLG
jgi:hypothetical protein